MQNLNSEIFNIRVKLVHPVTPVWSPLARTGVAAAGRISGNQLTLASTHRALASRYLHSLYTPLWLLASCSRNIGPLTLTTDIRPLQSVTGGETIKRCNSTASNDEILQPGAMGLIISH